MKEATSIIIHSENNTAVKCLTNEQAGILFKGILEYSSSGMPLESTDTALQALFSMFKVQIDRDFKKYSDRCEQNRLNALRRHQNGNNRPKILNFQLDYLKTILIDYLKMEEKKEVDVIPSIKDKIYRPIERREIAVANLNYSGNRDPKGIIPNNIMLLNFNYTKTEQQYIGSDSKVQVNHIHGCLDDANSVIFGYGDELDSDFEKLKNLNDNECLRNMKSIRYLEADNYRKLLEFIESGPFQVCIMGHSCGNSDRTLLNTLFEHRFCVSVKPYFYKKDDGTDNYLELVQNISRSFTDMKLMRDRVVNKTYCELLT